MPASLKRMRRTMESTVSSNEKMMELVMTVRAYDNGLITFDGKPLGKRDPVNAWVRTSMLAAQMIEEFQRQVARRHSTRSAA
jgi:hypothetical protein